VESARYVFQPWEGAKVIGYRFFSANSIIWRLNQGAVIPLSPPSSLAGFDKSNACQVRENQGAYLLRWESDFDSISGSEWWHIIKDHLDVLEDLPKKVRYMIRRSKRRYVARRVYVELILKDGYKVYSEAYKRYNTHEKMFSRNEFDEAVKHLPQTTEFWAVFEISSQRMVAFSENHIELNTCFYLTMWIEPEALEEFAGYLLFYEMEQHYLGERGFEYISDGARSLSHDTKIHEFLVSKFGFRKAFARLNIVYAPWLTVVVAIVFPFRRLIVKIPISIFTKASVLLLQEEIRRQFLGAKY